jgi:hypothetical protein
MTSSPTKPVNVDDEEEEPVHQIPWGLDASRLAPASTKVPWCSIYLCLSVCVCVCARTCGALTQ